MHGPSTGLPLQRSQGDRKGAKVDWALARSGSAAQRRTSSEDEPAEAGSQNKNGEPDRIRTCDPLIKSQLLYLLSYGPTCVRPGALSGGHLGRGRGRVKRA